MMKYLRLMILAFTAWAGIWTIQSASAAAPGEKIFGLRGGYVSRNNTAVAGLNFSYQFSGRFRIAPQVGYVFRHEGSDAFTFGADANWICPVALGGRLSYYPAVGFGYWWLNHHQREGLFNHTDDVSTRSSRFALNIGSGLELALIGNMRLGLAVRYVLMRHTPTLESCVSIGYAF